jgi:hypothetical protein
MNHAPASRRVRSPRPQSSSGSRASLGGVRRRDGLARPSRFDRFPRLVARSDKVAAQLRAKPRFGPMRRSRREPADCIHEKDLQIPGLFEAAEGIRTLDLLHGKQFLRFMFGAVIPCKRTGSRVRASFHDCPAFTASSREFGHREGTQIWWSATHGAVRRAVAAGRAVQAVCREAVVGAAEMRVPAIVSTFLRPASRRFPWRRFGSVSWPAAGLSR